MQALEAATEQHDSFAWPSTEPQMKWRIASAVFCLHLFALWLMPVYTEHKPAKNAAKKLVVHTVSLQPVAKIENRTIAPAPPIAQEVAEVKLEPEPLPVKEEEPVVEIQTPKQAEKIEKIEKIEKTEPAQKKIVQKAQPKKSEKKAIPKAVTKTTPKPKVQPKPAAKKAPAKAVEKPKPKVDSRAQEAAKRKKAELEAEFEKAQIEKALKAKQIEKQNAAINQALRSLDAAGSVDSKKNSLAKSQEKWTNSAPAHISKLAAESLVTIVAEDSNDFTPQERTYYDELVSRLKLSLKLPEYGEVKLQLCIARSGNVISVKSVKSKSKKNLDYVEKTLPKLHFPAFGQNFSGEKEHTFRLTLTNELNY